MDNESLSRAVRAAMVEAGFSSVTEFAEAAGMHQPQMSRYLNGSNRITDQALQRISDALGLTTNQLRRRAAKILLETMDTKEVTERIDELAERVSVYETESELRRDVRSLEDRLRRIEEKLDGDDDDEGGSR